MGDRWHVIGPGDRPLLVIQKKEVPGLFNETFWYCFESWQLYHYGFMKVDKYEDMDPDFIRYIILMESHFNKYFSHEAVITQYLEAIIMRQDIHTKQLNGLLRRR